MMLVVPGMALPASEVAEQYRRPRGVARMPRTHA